MKMSYIKNILTAIALLLILAGCAGSRSASDRSQDDPIRGISDASGQAGAGEVKADNAPLKPVEDEPSSRISSTHFIAIDRKTITPAQIRIQTGDTVTWSKTDSLKHRIASNDQEEDGKISDKLIFNSGELLYGNDVYSVRFNVPGTYEYRDVVYGTKAKIIVE